MLIQAAGAAPTLRARHRNLLNNMADANLRWLTEATNTDEQGKDRPCYHMTRDGLALLAMGFTGAKALAFKVRYIEAFNRMEATGEAPQRITKADLGRQTAAIIAAQMSPVVKLLESSERRLAALESCRACVCTRRWAIARPLRKPCQWPGCRSAQAQARRPWSTEFPPGSLDRSWSRVRRRKWAWNFDSIFVGSRS